MNYKVGDRVKIKSLDWYNEHKDETDDIECSNNIWFYREMSKFCEKVMTISHVRADHYTMVEDLVGYWTDEMIEGLAEDTITTNEQPFKPSNISLEKEMEWNLPDGYIFKDENGNIINATKIVLEKNIIREEQIDNAAQEYIDSDNAVLTYSDGFCEQTDHPFVRAAFKAGVEWADNNVTQDDCSKAPKLTSQDYSNGRFGYQLPAGFKAKLTERELILTPEKPKYPKNLLDCENELNGIRNDRKKLLHKFNELLIFRDAYWKIAGDEMGLGKPWEPDWYDDTVKYCIIVDNGIISKQNFHNYQFILAFPTEEMRDAFYENFKVEIESCKELL